MADHFYSGHVGDGSDYRTNTITVGTSATGANPIEVRITDGTMTAKQAAVFLEKLHDFIMSRDKGVIVAGTLIG